MVLGGFSLASVNIPVLWTIFAGNFIVFALGLWNGVRQRSFDGLLLAATFLLCLLLGMYDMLKVALVLNIEWPFLFPHTVTLLAAALMYLLLRRFLASQAQVQSASDRMAQELAAQQTALEHSHEQLRAAQEQQTLLTERQRLMQDMHDGLGSALTGVIRAAERGTLKPEKLPQVLHACLDDLRLAIDSMETAHPDLLLLLATLRYRLAGSIANAGITLEWAVEPVDALPWLEPGGALHILRIIQEAIANVLRHTHATQIKVTTRNAQLEGHAGVEVTIADNGAGFDVAQALAAAKGRGLQNQIRRADILGGKMSWQSDATGTRFALWLPVERTGR
jgi:signal transduction histidine kinase